MEFKTFTVKQEKNLIRILGGKHEIVYAIGCPDYPELVDFSFAIWHLLPLAIEGKFNIRIENPVDERVVQNAIKVSEIWQTWVPEKFTAVKIEAKSFVTLAHKGHARKKSLALYSGGLDSSFMIAQQATDLGIKDVLNVHGMDYRQNNTAGFSRHLNKTGFFLEKLNINRITLKTNLHDFVNGDHVWGLVLAGHGFLFNHMFEMCHFSADYANYQDFVAFPWGSNHVTNAYYGGTDFEFKPQSEQYTRSDKAKYFMDHSNLLPHLSFCTNGETKPDNCGLCSKCIRTKVMFLAVSGKIPEIFLDSSMERTYLKNIKNKKSAEKAFFLDLFQAIKKNNREEEMDYVIDYIKKKFFKKKNFFNKILKRGRNKRLAKFME